MYVVYTVFQIPSWLVVLSSEPASKILIKDEKWHEYQHGIHQIIIPSKSCEGVLSLDSSSNIQQEYRQLLVRVSDDSSKLWNRPNQELTIDNHWFIHNPGKWDQIRIIGPFMNMELIPIVLLTPILFHYWQKRKNVSRLISNQNLAAFSTVPSGLGFHHWSVIYWIW